MLAKEGVVDLRGQSVHEDGACTLDGEWEFYWQELYAPRDFFRMGDAAPPAYCQVPSSWTNGANAEGLPFPAYGYATYRLTVQLPENHPRLGLFIPKIWSASMIWVNEELVYRAGSIGTSYDYYKNKIVEELVELPESGDKLDIVVQVANFDMFIAGIVQSFQVGDYRQMLQNQSLQYTWVSMWIGVLLAMSLYHFLLYLFRRRRKSTLYFGLICLLVGIRLIIFGEHYLYEYLKMHTAWFNFDLQAKLYYGTTFALIPIGLLYIQSLYPVKVDPQKDQQKNSFQFLLFINRWFSPLSLGITGIYIVFMVATNPRVFLPTLMYFQSVIFVFVLFMIFLLFRAIFRKEKESQLQIFGISVMILAGVNDGLHQLGVEIFGTFESLPLAFGVFLSLQFVIIAQRFSRAFREVEDLSQNLEKKVIIRTREVTEQKRIIEEKNKEIESAYRHMTDSVVYASRIQKAILSSEQEILNNFQDAFIFWKPRDIVSGDFYWFAEVNGSVEKVKTLIAADCTGHGVPGAFMTVMGNDFLNEIILDNHLTNPSDVLCELDEKVHSTLKRQGAENGRVPQDGMDMSMITIHEDEQKLIFAGAKNPLYMVRDGEIQVYKGSKFPIGGGKLYRNKNFDSAPIYYQPGDVFYLTSDGFQDQFGGAEGRKYMKKRFRHFLLKISHLPMREQRQRIEEEFQNWMGDKPQTDDVLIVGIRF